LCSEAISALLLKRLAVKKCPRTGIKTMMRIHLSGHRGPQTPFSPDAAYAVSGGYKLPEEPEPSAAGGGLQRGEGSLKQGAAEAAAHEATMPKRGPTRAEAGCIPLRAGPAASRSLQGLRRSIAKKNCEADFLCRRQPFFTFCQLSLSGTTRL
jgi:hypothetical protein